MPPMIKVKEGLNGGGQKESMQGEDNDMDDIEDLRPPPRSLFAKDTLDMTWKV